MLSENAEILETNWVSLGHMPSILDREGRDLPLSTWASTAGASLF